VGQVVVLGTWVARWDVWGEEMCKCFVRGVVCSKHWEEAGAGGEQDYCRQMLDLNN